MERANRRVKESASGRAFPRALVENRIPHIQELTKPEEDKLGFIDYMQGIIVNYASRLYRK
jgi:hypothetical protein